MLLVFEMAIIANREIYDLCSPKRLSQQIQTSSSSTKLSISLFLDSSSEWYFYPIIKFMLISHDWLLIVDFSLYSKVRCLRVENCKFYHNCKTMIIVYRYLSPVIKDNGSSCQHIAAEKQNKHLNQMWQCAVYFLLVNFISSLKVFKFLV